MNFKGLNKFQKFTRISTGKKSLNQTGLKRKVKLNLLKGLNSQLSRFKLNQFQGGLNIATYRQPYQALQLISWLSVIAHGSCF